MTIFKFDIEPVAQARPRAVRQGGGVRVYDPPKTAQFKRELGMLARALTRAKKYVIPTGGISVNIQVVRTVPQSWSNKKRSEAIKGLIQPVTKPDLSNYIKSIEDALNGILWHDDNATVQLISSKQYGRVGRVIVEINEV